MTTGVFIYLFIYFHRVADKLREYHDDILLQQDIYERQKQRALHADLAQYWITQQRVEDSSDADLKCGLKGAFSITTEEGDLGPASMQNFQVGAL